MCEERIKNKKAKKREGRGRGEEWKGGTYPLGELRLGFLSCAGHQLEAAVLAGGLRGHCFVAPCSVGVCMGGWGVCMCVCVHGWVGVICMGVCMTACVWVCGWVCGCCTRVVHMCGCMHVSVCTYVCMHPQFRSTYVSLVLKKTL